MTAERRKKPRKPTTGSGMARFADKSFDMGCTLVDLTDTGARIAFAGRSLGSHEFDLEMEGCLKFRVRLVWRDMSDAGVRFIGHPVGAVPVPLEWARRALKAEADNGLLLEEIADLQAELDRERNKKR